MKVCDNASVAVAVLDSSTDTVLLIRRADGAGWALIAGHVFDDHAVPAESGDGYDDDASYLGALVAEAHEEAGLSIDPAAVSWVAGGWRPNACKRAPGPRGAGHQWRVGRVRVDGRPEVGLSARETTGHLWATRSDLAVLAARSIGLAKGWVTPEGWQDAPGIELVQVRWFVDLGVLDLPADVLCEIESALS